MKIVNRDSRMDDVSKTPPISRPRPGHADLAGSIKYLTSDCRETLERASARETASRVAAGALASPAGRISDVFKDSAMREAAYRFVENTGVDPEEIRRTAACAGFRRVLGEPYVLVPVDETTLTLPAAPRDSEMGPVGNRWSPALGVHAMSGIIVSREGVTVGTAAQVFWTRQPQEQLSRTRTFGVGKSAPRTVKKKAVTRATRKKAAPRRKSS